MSADAPLIVVVDDDDLFRRSVERLLRSSGFRVETFASAEALLERGDLEVTACAVLDMKLPGMSGLDLQRRLNLRQRPISTVFVSAHDELSGQARVLRAGAIAFLKKPFEQRALIDAIETAIKLMVVDLNGVRSSQR
jgi:two-component system, LuxR family, response regulator FixJ